MIGTYYSVLYIDRACISRDNVRIVTTIGECRKTASSHSRDVVLANSREDVCVSLSFSIPLCLRLYLSVEIVSTLLPERFRVAAATRTVSVDPTARKSRHCRRSNYQIVRHFSLERLPLCFDHAGGSDAERRLRRRTAVRRLEGRVR